MALFRPVEGEVVRADLTSPLHTLTFPTLELILVTGLSWMLIGWLDQPGMDTDPQLRNAVLLVWLLLAVWRFVPESLPAEKRTSGGMAPLMRAIGTLLRDRAYVGFTLGFIFSFSTMFAYVAASPFILQDHYGFTPVQFSFIFGTNTLGLFLMALTNARIVKRVGPLTLAKVGNIVLLLATLYLVTVALLDANRWFILVGLFVVVASMGINFANNSALAISRAGAVTGSASAFMGSGQFIMAGVLSPLVGVAAAAGMSQPVAMTAVMVATAAIAALGIHSGARQLTR